MTNSPRQRATFIAIPAAATDAPAPILEIPRNESGSGRIFLTIPAEHMEKLLQLSSAHSAERVQGILDRWRSRYPELAAVVPVVDWRDSGPRISRPVEGVVALNILQHRRLPVVADPQSAAWLRGTLNAQGGLPAGWQVYSTSALLGLIAPRR
jgi:hypothetical protein